MWRAVARRAAREAFARSDAVAAREIDAARAAASTLTRFRCVCGCASPAGAACERRSSSTSREDSSRPVFSAFSTTTTRFGRRFRATPRAFRSREEWARLVHEGHDVNPCNSPKHPAALAGIPLVDGKPMLSIQASYDEHSQCFVCGNAHAVKWFLAPPAVPQECLTPFVDERLVVQRHAGHDACFWARQGHSTAHRVGIVHPEPGRRPPGRRFVLHRTSGPRLRYAALSSPAFRPPRTRLTAAPARLHAAIPVPAAATTTTPALAALRRPFPPF